MYQCGRCKAIYEDGYVDDWGTHQESVGYGGSAVCTQLVDHRGAAKAADGSQPQAVCRGPLVYFDGTKSDLTAAEKKLVRQHTPIQA